MPLAELLIVELSAERGKDLANDNLARRPGDRIASRLAARAGDKATLSQDHEELCDMRCCKTLVLADLLDCRRAFHTLASDLDQASQAVFLLGGEFHSLRSSGR